MHMQVLPIRGLVYLAAVWLLAVVLQTASAATLDQTMSDADRRHLLARTGFGVAPEDYLALAGMTRREGVDYVIKSLRTEPTLPMPAWTRRSLPHYHARSELDSVGRQAFRNARDAEFGSLRDWWVAEMLEGSAATERLVLMWHDLVPSNYHAINRASLLMADQNALFRRMHQGPWADLLKALMRDAALLRFLNNDNNKRASPNENLGRELLELFTLGEGNYDEHTVREAARALTGFSPHDISYPAFRVHTWQQDRDEKQLFGQRGEFDADDLVDIILQQPAAARHLAKRYWHTFVSDIAPDEATLNAIATPFRDAGHDLSVLYKAVLHSDAFWAEEHRGMLIKSPVDVITGLARTLDFPKRDYQRFASVQAALGLGFFDPPNVAGWDEGEAWITPARLLARLDSVDVVVTGAGHTDASNNMMSASMSDEDNAMSMSMEGSAAADTAAETAQDSMPVQLRVAGEDLHGPAQLRMVLLEDDAELWTSELIAVPGGRNTQRYGLAATRADLMWQSLNLSVPDALGKRADAVRVDFTNDAANDAGDRNLYVEFVRLGDTRLDAATGVQVSSCVPENAARAGNLYCDGGVTISVPVVPAVAPSQSVGPRAAAVRLRYVNHNKNTGTVRANLVLEHVHINNFQAELVQFSLVSHAGKAPELRIDSFDCRPECMPVWPECAWRDPHFTAAASARVALSRNARRDNACLESGFDPDTRAWLSLIADEAPRLLAQLSDSRQAQRRPKDFALLRARVDQASDRRQSSQITIDASLAPAPIPLEPGPVLSPRVDNLEALATALAASDIDPLELLWPGFTEPPSWGRADATVRERLAWVLAHPAFQVR